MKPLPTSPAASGRPTWRRSVAARILSRSTPIARLDGQRCSNALSAAVGDGWYRGHLTWHKNRDVYGDTCALLAQLEVTLADGTTVTIATDDHCRTGYGDLLAADLYDGCERDLRQEPHGWRLPGFDDRGWEQAVPLLLPAGPTQRAHPPVRVVQVIQPEQRVLADGTIAVDAGENVTGWLRLRARGPAGGTLTVRHAEVLDGDGRLPTSILRGARAIDRYTLADEPAELEPEFTFHNFRYAEISLSPSIATPYGTASVAWSLSGTTLTVDVSLPPGTTGHFSIPEGWRCTTPSSSSSRSGSSFGPRRGTGTGTPAGELIQDLTTDYRRRTLARPAPEKGSGW